MCYIVDYNNTAVYNQNEKRNIAFQDINQKKRQIFDPQI